jgi:hypothetical protein
MPSKLKVMTEIKIEKKKPIWPLIVLGAFSIGLMLYVFNYIGKETRVNVNLENTKKVSSDVSSYMQFIDNGVDSMDLSHEFTKKALTLLIEAIKVTAYNNSFDIKADLASVSRVALDITKDPYETNHADKIRNAADILTSTLENLQKEKFPNLTNDLSELKTATSAINSSILTLNQKTEVRNFFDKSKDLLEKMNN